MVYNSSMPETGADLNVSHEVAMVLKEGEKYANAFRILDPSLGSIQPETDTAVGFDIGRGADAVAFRNLGFKNAIVTNDPSAVYSLVMRGSAESEERAQEGASSYFPDKTRVSSLGVSDWLGMEDFSPRLVTMLRMAPRCFGDTEDGEDPAYFLKIFLPLVQKPDFTGTVILSALTDHPCSGAAFEEMDKLLEEAHIPHTLYMDENVTPELACLGQRILVIKGKQ
jgi:hypothetical protein